MIRNFITIAWRNMWRNKAYTFINLIGLSVGVACCLILALYIQDEFSYDKHHQDGERIFRITSSSSFTDFKPAPRTSPPIAWGIKDEIPEFEAVTRVVNPIGASQSLIRYEDNQFYEERGFLADSTLTDLLTYPFIEGNPEKSLTDANTVIICDALSRKIFGDQSALNKVISITQGGSPADYRVTGVFRNEAKSHLEANFFTSMTSSGWAEYTRHSDVADEWAGQNFMIAYVKLRPGYSLTEVTKKMNEVFLKHGAEDLKAMGMTKRLGLEPVEDIYMYSAEGNQTPRITYIYIVASIAVFILLIACINFMNLSTAVATKRALEVGLRKTLGAQRGLLIRQFLSETFVIITIAILFSCMTIQLALPAFNQITGKSIAVNTENISFIISSLVGITLVTGFIAGSYPAFYLSSFQPATILKGKSVFHASSGLLRQALVVFQFVIAITLVCGMIIVTRQLTYMQEQNPGFNSTHKLVLPLRTQTAKNNYFALKNEFDKIGSVNNITATEYIPGNDIFSDFGLYPDGSSMEKAVLVKNNWVEPNYLDMMGIKLIAGNNFPETRDSLSWTKVIVNQTTAKSLGFTPDGIVGEMLHFDWQGERYSFEVLGVMEDYHQVSLRNEINPVLFRVANTPDHDFMIADVNGQNIRQTIREFESIWKTMNSDTPFEFTFLDENIQKQYTEDKKISTVITTFTVIAMIISCLGLYGLSTYMAEKRFKEIGVRKVLGASVRQILLMMTSEFVRLVVIAFVIAIPISLYGMTQWLEGFAYKVSPDISLYVLAGSTAILIAMLTISFESFRAASGNPVRALRSE